MNDIADGDQRPPPISERLAFYRVPFLKVFTLLRT